MNISQANALAGDAGLLQLHGLCDILNQLALITHPGVDGRQNAPLQGFLLQGRGAMTVFFAVVQTADTAPDDFPFASNIPGAAPVERTAFSADQPLGEGVFAGVGGQARGSVLFGRAFSCGSSGKLSLYCIKGFTVHDSNMMVLYQILRELARILYHLLADAVLNKGFLFP